MPDFPQYQNGVLVEYATYTTTVLTGSAGATIAANSGDVRVIQVNAVNVSGTATITLPSVALGGPVLVKFTSNDHDTAFGTAARVKIVPAAADVTAGALIDGYGSVTLQNLGDQAVFASDGTNWWVIDKSHNTTDSW